MRNSISVTLLCTAALAMALGGCDKAAGGKGADADSVKKAIQADEAKWNEQFKSKDTEGLVGHYADDAFFAAPGVA
jgi:hypothetical protein